MARKCKFGRRKDGKCRKRPAGGRRGKRPANKGKKCVRFKRTSGGKRCAKFS